jgi:hypothetical protein
MATVSSNAKNFFIFVILSFLYHFRAAKTVQI